MCVYTLQQIRETTDFKVRDFVKSLTNS